MTFNFEKVLICYYYLLQIFLVLSLKLFYASLRKLHAWRNLRANEKIYSKHRYFDRKRTVQCETPVSVAQHWPRRRIFAVVISLSSKY